MEKIARCLLVVGVLKSGAVSNAQLPALTTTKFTNGNFEFLIQGESKARYVVLESTNATDWSPIATNQDFNASRPISVPAPHPAALFTLQQASTPAFGFALLATDSIQLIGNSLAVDSFDSRDPNFSTDGHYNSAKRKGNGDVAAIKGPVSVGNSDVVGHVWVGSAGQTLFGPSSSVGDTGWVSSHFKIMPGYVRDDLVVTVPPIQAPFHGGAFTPASGMYNGLAYDYSLGNGNYQIVGDLSMGSKNKMLITGTNTVLYVTGNFSMSGQSSITLLPGTSLKLYVAGASGGIGGNGIFNPGAAADFRYYGLQTHTNIAFYPNSAFNGVVYAPDAAFSANNGGVVTNDISGAVIAKTIKISGLFLIHYDEALEQMTP